MQTDKELLERIDDQDAEAFEVLLERYRAPIHRHISRMVVDKASTDDLVQEVFLKVWTNSGQWDGTGSFKSWLFRIATNTCLNHLRTTRRRRETILDVTDGITWESDETETPNWMADTSVPGPEEALGRTVQRETVRKLLSKLPEDKQQVISMIYGSDMDIREAASALGIPEGTVKSRLHYALRRLARDWNNLEGEEEV